MSLKPTPLRETQESYEQRFVGYFFMRFVPVLGRQIQGKEKKTIIHNNEVETVSKYKYLGTIFDDKLKWDQKQNTYEIVKKGQRRLYLLRKLNYFSVDQKILTHFYKSFIESVLSFSFICWFHSVGMKNRNSLQRIVRIASKITAVPQRDLALFCEQQILRKARSILTNKDRILN